MEFQINFLAVIAAAVSSFLIGALWYSPVLFGNAWMQENGFKDEDLKNANMAKIFGSAFILSFIIALNLAAFLGAESDVMFGVFAGAAAGIGWVAASLGILYLFERKSLKLFFINAGYHAVTFTIMGAILGAWK
ncbi:MAG: DUF1761 domain-containing protein [Melioribacteraceae bacterium]|nr:DUF1761 domain-containing protein [Melioribacteraceae bacterium]MCF8353371.1 DUF1761 domain-containing protein [Melioribacteraceae bacterium]MCF8393050.1 DUF1761 domain-containing protein [Melioribacteraceae bacterium]MCF8419097.1 DUF1761 domain-containing protein [Melioribacteraceae bacterium]